MASAATSSTAAASLTITRAGQADIVLFINPVATVGEVKLELASKLKVPLSALSLVKPMDFSGKSLADALPAVASSSKGTLMAMIKRNSF